MAQESRTLKDMKPASRVTIEFGRKVLKSQAQADLRVGAVVDLEAFVDDYVELYADGQWIARGRPVVIDGKLGVKVQESLGGQLFAR
jgi:flagellar motor switch/type III secretory pathway protein FliN